MHNRFATGTGCYTCRICGRKTRKTEPDAAYQKACAQCWEVAGLENEQSDYGDPDGRIQRQIDELNAEIVTLGGKV